MDINEFQIFDEDTEIRRRKDFEHSHKLSINAHFDKLEVKFIC